MNSIKYKLDYRHQLKSLDEIFGFTSNVAVKEIHKNYINKEKNNDSFGCYYHLQIYINIWHHIRVVFEN